MAPGPTPSVRLLAAGDTSLGGLLRGQSAADVAAGLESVRAIFAAADVRFLSFDCAIGSQGEPPHPDEYIVDCEASQLPLLADLGVDIVSLANNHSTDHGMASLTAGIARLRDLGVSAVGAGGDLAQAMAPVVVERGGLRLGFLAFASEHPWVGAFPATIAGGGVAPLRSASAEAAVAALRASVDAVIVSMHWGKEFIPLPPPENVKLARGLIDSGASVVLGHHPHVVQPVERHGDGVICYSLGNFLFPDDPQQGLAFHGAQRESLLVTIEVSPGAARPIGVQPVVGEATGRVRPVSWERARQIDTELAAAAATLGTAEHERRWAKAVRQHEWQRLRRVVRDEVLAAGWRGGTARVLRLGRKNILSVGRSLGEILTFGRRRA